MAKECITNCPRIQVAIENFPEGTHPDVATSELLAACEATYECGGPEPSEVSVVTGFFQRREENKPGFNCGLPAES